MCKQGSELISSFSHHLVIIFPSVFPAPLPSSLWVLSPVLSGLHCLSSFSQPLTPIPFLILIFSLSSLWNSLPCSLVLSLSSYLGLCSLSPPPFFLSLFLSHSSLPSSQLFSYYFFSPALCLSALPLYLSGSSLFSLSLNLSSAVILFSLTFPVCLSFLHWLIYGTCLGGTCGLMGKQLY